MSAATQEIDTRGSLRLDARLTAPRYATVKSALDFVGAFLLLGLLSPVLLFLMLLVRLTSKGPAVYSQRRLGKDGKEFTILKLRSMYMDSERDGIRWSRPGDPRVTPLGRFLRASHLDEVPQLLNVLRGEMSLVGPRPERPEIIAQLELALPDYHLRLQVRPGLTGLAQVLQAPDTDLTSVRRKLNYDLYYLDRLSFGFDLRLLFGTVLVLLAVPPMSIAALLRLPDETLHEQQATPMGHSVLEGVETVA